MFDLYLHQPSAPFARFDALPSPPTNMSSIKFKLPDLISPIPSDIKHNPFVNSVGADSDAWIKSFGFLDDPRAEKAYYESKFNLFTEVAYPESDELHFRLACDYINLFFVFDDMFDSDSVKKSPAVMKAAIKAFLHCVKDPENVNPNSNAVAALQEYVFLFPVPSFEYSRESLSRSLMKRVVATGLTNTTKRLQKALEGFFYSQSQKDFDPTNNIFPSIDAYIAHRRLNAGGYISFLFMEVALDVDLPDHVVEHPVLRRILDIAIDVGVFCNASFFLVEDLFSSTPSDIRFFLLGCLLV